MTILVALDATHCVWITVDRERGQCVIAIEGGLPLWIRGTHHRAIAYALECARQHGVHEPRDGQRERVYELDELRGIDWSRLRMEPWEREGVAS